MRQFKYIRSFFLLILVLVFSSLFSGIWFATMAVNDNSTQNFSVQKTTDVPYRLAAGENHIYVVAWTQELYGGSYYLLKFDAKGNFLLKKNLGWVIGNCRIEGLAVGDSCLYAAGRGELNPILIKYDENLNEIWTRNWEINQNYPTFSSVVVDNNSVYAVGSYQAGTYYGCIVKYDENGNQLWNQSWLMPGNSEFDDVVVDTNGDVVMAGKADTEIAVVKYDSSGTLVWSETCGSYSSWAYLAVDALNDVYVMIWGGSRFYKVNSTGYYLWNQTLPGLAGLGHYYGVEAIGSSVYVVGLNYDNRIGCILLKYNTQGDLQWSKNYREKYVRMMTAYGEFIYLCGSQIYHEQLEAGLHDVYLMKCTQEGNVIWTQIYWNEEINFIFLGLLFGVIGLISAELIIKKLMRMKRNKDRKTYSNIWS